MSVTPVVVIGLTDNVVQVEYEHGCPTTVILDFDQIQYTDHVCYTAAGSIEEVLPLPIDTIFRIGLINAIFIALGSDERCLPQFNEAADGLDLPHLEDIDKLAAWPGWLAIEQNRNGDGSYTA